MRRNPPALLLLAGALILAAPAAVRAAAGSPAPPAPRITTHDDRTVVTFPAVDGPARPGALHALVPLPVGADGCRLELTAGTATRLSTPQGIVRLRGRSLISLLVEGPGPDAVSVAVMASGSGGDDPRLTAAPFAAALADAGAPGAQATAGAGCGSYVVVSPPAYSDAAGALAAWKRRKGFPAVVALTSEIGTANTTIKAWLQEAYDTWDAPPAYLVLLGDVDDIPAWSISQNLTDQPYACLDGDDWLPDLCIGRLSVESAYEAAAVVAKTVGYEREPDTSDAGWFTRSLMVAANYPAVTPVHTVLWCGTQLETLGFAPAASVIYDPYEFPPDPDHRIWDGGELITGHLETGVSIVAYRGWAYGVYGWEPPQFTTDDIPAVANGGRLPVVLSFVCDTANYSHESVCMGESFLRQGTPEQPRGAVAFFGNTEFWSHTRFNDALAISFFERVTDPAVTDLGGWILAGKLRFMDFFPLELHASDMDEESVEFYFNIYNLLGDPELNFWRTSPTALAVTHAATLPAGAALLEVTVREADGVTPRPGARVGVVQGETLLGCGLTDASGLAEVALTPVVPDTPVHLTVTHPGRLCYEATLSAGDGGVAHLAAAGLILDDDATAPSDGNGDGHLNPGETVALALSVANGGSPAATAATGLLTLTGPADVLVGTAAYGDVPGGQTADSAAPFVLALDPDAADGAVLDLLLEANHSGDATDRSRLGLTVAAPVLTVTTVAVGGDGLLRPGRESTLLPTLRNDGSAATAGAVLSLALLEPGLATLTDDAARCGALVPGATATTEDGFALSVAEGVPPGTVINLALQAATDEGWLVAGSCALTVGRIDAGLPSGPDRYGYRAYDSADIEYPDQVPAYRWTELSPAYGGSGTALTFLADGELQVVSLPFPFVYYGQTYEQIRISDNGWIAFDTAAGNEFYNWPIPTPHGNGALVAPFWDNFVPDPEDLTRPPPDGVYHAHDAEAGTFTVEWSRASHFSTEIDDLQTFQVVLRDPARYATPTGDGEILFLYRQVRNGDHLRSYATIGLESPAEDDGLQLSYANLSAAGFAPVTSGLAVKLTTAPPVHVPYVLAALAARPEGGGVRIAWMPADDRPVTGWRLLRLGDGTARPVTERPLLAGCRKFLDEGGDEDAVYRLEALHPFGHVSRHGPVAAAVGPLTLELHPCRPNPVRSETRIEFGLPRSGPVRLRVYDLAGRRVRTLLAGTAPGGTRHLIWDGRDDGGRAVADGVYLYRLEAGGEVRTRKLLLVR